MFVMEAGIEIFVKLAQSLNAPAPIVVTEDGISTVVIPSGTLKSFVPSFVKSKPSLEA